MINALTRRPQDLAVGGSGPHHLLDEHPQADSATSEQIDWESRRELYRLAAIDVRREVRPDTWEVFARIVIERESVEHVAQSTGKSIGAVYVAKCRVLNRLRDCVRQLEDES